MAPRGSQGVRAEAREHGRGRVRPRLPQRPAPVELGRRLVREMDDNRSVDVRGRTVVPNPSPSRSSHEDNERFAEIQRHLTRELCDAAREHARDEGYTFLGPVEVELVDRRPAAHRAFQIEARMREGPGGVGAGSSCSPTATGTSSATRPSAWAACPSATSCSPTATSAAATPRSARGDGFVVVDLGSTNGTRVNGVRVSRARAARRRRAGLRQHPDAVPGLLKPGDDRAWQGPDRGRQ